MNTMIPYVLGFLTGELLQLGAWKMGHSKLPWKGYLQVGPAHWAFNLGIVAVVGVMWKFEILGPVLSHFGITPIAQLLTISPPFGYLMAVAADVLADKYAYGIVARFLRKSENTETELQSQPQEVP